MKTKQEQIIEMANIIKNDYKQWLDITGVFPEGSSYYFECLGGGFDCARLLYEAGYGDVSEYKAEIARYRVQDKVINGNFDIIEVLNNTIKERDVEVERLKAKNNELKKKNWSLEEELKKKELEITYARNNGYEKGYDECEEYMKDKIKQAKIDALNELKERIKTAIDTYYNSDGGGYYLAEDVLDDIDLLIEGVKNDQR